MLCVHTNNSNAQEYIWGILRVYLIYILCYDFPSQVQVLQLANSPWSCRDKLKRKTTLRLPPKYFGVSSDWGGSWCVSEQWVTQHQNWCLHQCIFHSLFPQGIFPGLLCRELVSAELLVSIDTSSLAIWAAALLWMKVKRIHILQK